MEDYADRIDQAVEGVLSKVYNELGITTGDIPPELAFAYDEHIEGLAHIFEQLVDFNK